MAAIRERKKAETRRALSETLLEESLKRGFDNTPVEDITDLVGVSRRTFFRYFGSKEEALFDPEQERLDWFKRTLEDGRDLPPYERVRQALLAVAGDYMADQHSVMRRQEVINESKALRAFDQRMDESWEDATRDSLGGGFAAAVHAGALIGVARAVIRRWITEGGREDLVAMGIEALGLITLEGQS